MTDDDDFRGEAVAIRAPVRGGERGTYGGDWYVTVAGFALCTGAGVAGERLAREVARRWNAAPPPLTVSTTFKDDSNAG